MLVFVNELSTLQSIQFTLFNLKNMRNKFLLLNPFFGIFISKVFDQIKFFIALCTLLFIQNTSIGQECIEYPDIEGPACIICWPDDWNPIGSPDMVDPFGSNACWQSGISGSSPSGNNVTYFGTTGITYGEGMSTTVNNLTPGQCYTFGIWWETTTFCGAWNVPGSLRITIQGEDFIFSGATEWELAQATFTAASSSVVITVAIVIDGVQHSIVVDGVPDCSLLAPEPCCTLTVSADDSHEICPGTSINLNALVQNATGNLQVEWTSIPTNGVNFLNDVNILNPIFTFPSGDFEGETFDFLLTVTDERCTKTTAVEVTVLKSELPTFDFSVCELAGQGAFPNLSMNGYEGTWSGNFNLTELAGTNETYTFTLAANEVNCIRQADFNIDIIEADNVTFDVETSFCSDDNNLYTLPTVSQDLVSGIWVSNAFTPAALGEGSFEFTFNPESQFCALPYKHSITIKMKPVFDTLICASNEAMVLDPMSTNGILGSWNPPVINPEDMTNNEFVSIWNPVDPMSTCVKDLSVTFLIQQATTLSFDLVDSLFLNTGIYNLPSISLEGINGQWNIPNIDTDLLPEGTVNLTFISPEFCVQDFQADIVLIKEKSVQEQCSFTIDVPQDITICDPANVNLAGVIDGDFLLFEWSSSSGYSNKSELSPIVPVASTTTFTLSAKSAPTSNSIVNGNFSSGNVGFTTDYNFVNNVPGNPFELGVEGTYSVINNPNLVHGDFASCPDNGGNGNMLVVNGSSGLQEVWCQIVNINPNSTYVFQAFATSVVSSSPAILQFSINGNLLGSPFVLSGSTCVWEEFFETWESGGNTTAEICITNQNTTLGGNDFAIDDIFFNALCSDEKSFTVTLEPFILEQPIDGFIDCNNPETLLTVIPVPNNSTYMYQWATSVGNIVSGQTTESVSVSAQGEYVITVTNAITGCSEEETFVVNDDFVVPEIDIKGNLNLDCQNNSSILSFNTSFGIENSAVWTLPSGVEVQTSSVIISTEGLYIVNVEATNGCVGTDSVFVNKDESQIFYQTESSGPLTCEVNTASIYIDFISNVDSVTWSGLGIVKQSTLGDSILVNTPGTYIFELHEGKNCRMIDSITIATLPSLHQYQVQLPDTLSCRNNKAWLSLQNVQGVNSIVWLDKDIMIGNGDSLLVENAGTYYVEVTDPNGCRKLDSISIFADLKTPVFSVDVDSINCVRQLGQFNVNYAGQGTFLWNGPDTVSNLKNPTFAKEGSYRLTVTAENGCTDSLDVYLPSSVDFPSINADISPITCKNPIGKIVLNTKQTSLINWVDDQGNIGSGDTISSNIPRTYSIKVTAPNGCENSTTYTLNVDTLSPIMNDIAPNKLTCDILSVKPKVLASNYTNFIWEKDGIIISEVSLEPTFSTPGTYQLKMQNANGCTSTRSYTVTQDITKPNFKASANDLSCMNPTTTLTLTGDSTNTYRWLQKDEKIQAGLVISQPQTITIRATNNLGCDSTITLDIKGNFAKPIIDVSPVTINCFKPSVWVKNQILDPSLNYVWNTEQGIIVSDSLRISDGGFYQLVATNVFGCSETQEIVISVDKTKPTVDIIGDSVITCFENNTRLTASVNMADVQFQWTGLGQNMGTNTSLSVSEAGTYSIAVTNMSNGCTNNKTIQVNKQNAPEAIDFVLDQPKCFGEKGRFVINKIINGTDPYDITFNGKKLMQNEPLDVTGGVYKVVVKDANGCQVDSSFLVKSVDDFFVDAGPDGTINQSEKYQIQALSDKAWFEIDQISWQPSDNLSCSDCPSPIADPISDTEYTIQIMDKDGCFREDKVWVRVKLEKGFTTPNIINTTSNQGNQYFTIFPKYESIKSIISLKIYDRWGNHVFNTQNITAGQPNLGWDGTHGGQYVVPGVYVWTAQLLMIDDEIIQTNGDITVVR